MEEKWKYVGLEIYGRHGKGLKINVLFPDVGYIAKATLKAFEEGTVQVPDINSRQFKRVSNYKDHIGEKNVNQYGENTVIIDYINANNVIIGFDDGSQKQAKYRDFTNGFLKSDSLIRKRNKRKNSKVSKKFENGRRSDVK